MTENTNDRAAAGTELQVSYDERGVALWVRPQLGVPIVMSPDNAAQLIDDLTRAIADHGKLMNHGG